MLFTLFFYNSRCMLLLFMCSCFKLSKVIDSYCVVIDDCGWLLSDADDYVKVMECYG